MGSEFAWFAPRKALSDCNGDPLGQIDYANVKNTLAGSPLNTKITGSVSQVTNTDGTSTVSVKLNTTNAYAIAYCFDPNTGNCSAPAPCFGSLKFNGTATGALRAITGFPDGTRGTMSIISIATNHVVGRAGRNGRLTADLITISPGK